jgi:hypothetical protein
MVFDNCSNEEFQALTTNKQGCSVDHGFELDNWPFFLWCKLVWSPVLFLAEWVELDLAVLCSSLQSTCKKEPINASNRSSGMQHVNFHEAYDMNLKIDDIPLDHLEWVSIHIAGTHVFCVMILLNFQKVNKMKATQYWFHQEDLEF